MDTRYSHPEITRLWSPEWTYQTWLLVERNTLAAQLNTPGHPLTRETEAAGLLAQLDSSQFLWTSRAVDEIRRVEARTKHDVVAFLEWFRPQMGEKGKWLHWGLTSSDVVDTTQGIRFENVRATYLLELRGLTAELDRLAADRSPLLARTHGQVAEPTQLFVRVNHWRANLLYWANLLQLSVRAVATCKLSGPVGTYTHNSPEVEARVAESFGLTPVGGGASQIAPRASLAAWASHAAGVVEACGKIALDVRLMKLTGEAFSSNLDGQVGSSAMPHKKNPIREEQIGGMVRLARGYAQALQPLDGWLERDIAHSSVERVAVPDLWHVLLHTIKATRSFLATLDVDSKAVAKQYDEAGVAPLTSTLTLNALPTSESNQDARAKALRSTSKVVPQSSEHFVRHYPGVS